MRKIILKLSSLFMFILGIGSLFLSISVMFHLFHIRKPSGHYPLFVLIGSLVCSLFHLFAGYGFYKEDRRTTTALFIAGLILIFTFMGLLIHILTGGLFEADTIKTLIIRTFVTIVFLIISWIYLIREKMIIP